MLSKDVQYYVAVTYTPDGNGGVIEKQYVKKVGDSGSIWNNTVTRDNWSVTANAAQGYFWLGHSTGNDNDTNIDFDEVRIWNGALSADALTLSVEKGPSGGIVTAKPRKLTGDLDGYWLYLKSGKARIGRHPGVTIIAY